MTTSVKAAIKKFGMHAPMRIYDHVKTYDELLQTGKAYLQGKMSESITHGGAIDDETIPLVKDLVRLHDVGKMFTVDSQPGSCTTGKTPHGETYVEQQKPYICAFVPKEQMEVLVRHFKKSPGAFVYVFEEFGSTKRVTNFGEPYNVTRDKIVGQEWRYYTNIPPFKDEYTTHEFRFVQGSGALWYAAIAMTAYCHGDLAKELLRVFQHASFRTEITGRVYNARILMKAAKRTGHFRNGLGATIAPDKVRELKLKTGYVEHGGKLVKRSDARRRRS